MANVFTAEHAIAFLTLTVLEIVLGIDNVIFIAILAGKLPKTDQDRARRLGIAMAVGTRILLLLSISWVMSLTNSLLTVLGNGLSGRDLILLIGGAFLIGKSTYEIHERLEVHDAPATPDKALASVGAVVAQIAVIDIVFSLDSVITAVGISGELLVMIPAVIIAAGVMLYFAGAVSEFIEHHPTMKILALSFLILIGTLLVIEGWNAGLAEEYRLKNYAYFAMAFSVGVEFLNIRIRKKADPVQLRNQPHLPAEARSQPDKTRNA